MAESDKEKKDKKRHEFARMMDAHRQEWDKFGMARLTPVWEKDRKAIRSIFRATSSPAEALERIKSYYTHQAGLGWKLALKSLWVECGKATIHYIHAFVTGKSLMRIEVKQDDDELPVQAAWESRVGTMIQGDAFKDKIVGIDETTQADIRSTIADGVKNGDSHFQIGNAVDGKLGNSWEGRGQTISRTEANSAMNRAYLQDAQAMTPDLNKVWSTTGLDNVREWHQDADAQSVPQDEPFNVNGEDLDCPGDEDGSPENIINCACTMTLEPPEEWATHGIPEAEGEEAEGEMGEGEEGEGEGIGEVAPEVPEVTPEITPELTPEPIPEIPEVVPPEIGGFPVFPADGFETNKEVNDWLVDNGMAKSAILKGLDQDAANQVGAAVADMYRAHPDMYIFDQIGSKSSATSAASVKTWMSSMFGAGKQDIERMELNISPTAFGSQDKIDNYWQFAQTGTAAWQKMKTRIQVADDTPFFVDAYGSKDNLTYNTLIHEMSHAWNNSMSYEDQKAWTDAYNVSGIRQQVMGMGSGYGGLGKNKPAEGFAEMNELYVMGKKDRIPNSLLSLLDHYYLVGA